METTYNIEHNDFLNFLTALDDFLGKTNDKSVLC